MGEQNKIRPLFIFSLPRSGSTLLQKILAHHPAISTSAETWLLLPILSWERKNAVFADYGHFVLRKAIAEFCDSFPAGRKDYDKELRKFVFSLYEKKSRGKGKYFLDKTPRYHLIADRIIDLFPEGKFIFLWRNPLAVAASIIETFGGGDWNIYKFNVDFYKGVTNLVKAWLANQQKALSVQFEKLLHDPENTAAAIFSYLDLENDSTALSKFHGVNLEGSLGDPTGIKKYSSISTDPLDKWKNTMATPQRKRWCRKYIQWLGEKNIHAMGYDFEELNGMAQSLSTDKKRIAGDTFRMLYGFIYNLFEFHLVSRNIKNMRVSKIHHNHI